ncbi:MAG: hypothetical protein FWH55_11915 [Oscillospiraceae bacterium]|nr:hypothetical protein [Oscillospiraceae bacterium]
MEPMTAEQAAKAAEGLTFEKVWAAMMESGKRADQQMEQLRDQMRESRLEADKQMKEMQKSIGGLGNSLGRLTEEMFSAELYKKFSDIGFTFTKQAERVKFNENKQVIAEVDLFLENGEYVMLVEIKTDLSISDVDRHIEKIGIIRKYMDTRGDARKIVGAVAGGIVPEKVLKYAQSRGLYVVVQSGDAVEIANISMSFTAREW